MTSKTTITKTASNPRQGMTLGELRQFLDDATRQGARDDQTVKGRVTIRGTIRTLTAEHVAE